MINLGAVCIIGKAELETSRVEVLIHAGGIEPVGTDATREVEIKVLHTEVVRLVIEFALEPLRRLSTTSSMMSSCSLGIL